MITDRLNLRQLYFLLVAVTVPTEMDLMPSMLLRVSHRDAPFSVMGASLLAIVPLLLAISFIRRSPLPFIDLLVRAYGRFGRVLLGVFAAVLLLGMVIIFAEALIPVRMVMLPHTPGLVLTVLGIFLIWYVADGGPFAAAQVASVVMVLLLCVVVFVLPLTAKYMEWGFILPPWPLQMDRVLMSVWAPFGFMVQVSIVVVAASWAHSQAAAVKAAVWALVTDAVLILVAVTVPLLVFGPEYAANLALPFTSSVRVIHYGFILERLDVFATIIWIIGIGIKDAIWAIVAAVLLAGAWGRRPSSLLTAVLVIGTGLLSLWLLPGLPNVLDSIRYWWTETAVPIWGFVLLLAVFGVHRVARQAHPA